MSDEEKNTKTVTKAKKASAKPKAASKAKASSKPSLGELTKLKQAARKERNPRKRREKLIAWADARDKVLGRKSKTERIKEAWKNGN